MTNNEIAAAMVTAIKKNLATRKKSNPNFKTLSIEIEASTEWSDKTRVWSPIVRVGYRYDEDSVKFPMGDINTLYGIGREFEKEFNKLKGTKGWSHLSYSSIEVSDGEGWHTRYVQFPSKVTLMAEVCKEFKSLANYLVKYGNCKLSENEIFSVHIGGKRGRIYGEESDRMYLCHYPNKCSFALNELRKARGTKDKMSVKFEVADDIDPFDLQVSIRNETEFSGFRQRIAKVTITTPSGKTKNVSIAL